jgi:hypothetical protein
MDQKSGFSFPGILRYISSMPSQIAHFIFAQDLVSALSPSDQNRIQPEYLFLGAQGPDIFYHNLRTKPSGVFYGGLMHRRDWGRMTLALLKGGPELHTDPRWYSYLLGWISHGLLDRAWHPYIIYRSGWHQPSLPETRVWRFYHPFLERLCDVLLFQEKTGRNLWEEPFQPRMPAYAQVEGLLMSAFAGALAEVYNKDDDPQLLRTRLENTFSDALGFFDHFNPQGWEPYGWQGITEKGLRLVHPRIIPAVDFLNKTHAPWIHPGTLVEQNSSLLDLYEEAKKEGMRILQDWQGQKSWRDPQNLLKNTSLNLTDAQGRRVGPEISDPFDLHKVMLDQLQWLKGSPTR